MHKPLSDKIVELEPYLTSENASTVMSSLRAMGPLCFFDNCKNADEIAGAIKVLDWLLAPLKP